MRLQIIWSFTFLQVTNQIGAELFSSSEKLGQIVYAEKGIAELLRNYTIQQKERIEKLSKIAEEYETHADNAMVNLSSYVGNPINAYLLIKRFTLDWQQNVSPVIYNNTWDLMFEKFKENNNGLPTFEDIKGTYAAISRLTTTYNLNISEVVRGNLRGMKSPVLTEEECYEIGHDAYMNAEYHFASHWMEEALTLRKANKSGECDDIKCADILETLSFSYFRMDNVPLADELIDKVLSIDPNNQRAKHNKRYYKIMMPGNAKEQKISREETREKYSKSIGPYFSQEYSALCRGETIKEIKGADKFTCRYVTNNHPLLILQPAKEETKNLDPPVVIFHDFLNDYEMDLLKNDTKPMLNRSMTVDPTTGQGIADEDRVSQDNYAFGDSEAALIDRMESRIEAITGRSKRNFEKMQVANYGIGGHYGPHYDHDTEVVYTKPEIFVKGGNREATFMSYLSDVEAGGATAFPLAGLQVFPKKGSAIFWYNLYQNGTGNYNALHGACPVLVGSKWIGTTWIRNIPVR